MKSNKEYSPIHRKLSIILAEDDNDDLLLFEEAIDELPVSVQLRSFTNGDDLIEWLTNKINKLPDVLFLDLNMPRKNGFATLGEIKRNTQLEHLPVIIFSTTTNTDMIQQVFNDAAHYFIRKPIHFLELKELIYKALKLIADHETSLPDKEHFMLMID